MPTMLLESNPAAELRDDRVARCHRPLDGTRKPVSILTPVLLPRCQVNLSEVWNVVPEDAMIPRPGDQDVASRERFDLTEERPICEPSVPKQVIEHHVLVWARDTRRAARICSGSLATATR